MTMIAQTTSTSTNEAVNYNSSQQVQEDQNQLDKDAFFELLLTQLQYQDPLNPMDNTQFISQMAQFSSLEQMENMNRNMDMFLRIQSVSEGAALIGRTVETIDPETGDKITGKVKRVDFVGGNSYAIIDGTAGKDLFIDIKGITSIH